MLLAGYLPGYVAKDPPRYVDDRRPNQRGDTRAGHMPKPGLPIGSHFGFATIVAALGRGWRGRCDMRYRFRCDCGYEFVGYAHNVRARTGCSHGGRK